MLIDIDVRDGAAVIRPAGTRLDLQVAGEFRGALLQSIEAGHRCLVVDMEAVDFIDSSGLGALVSALKSVKRLDKNGDVKLANVQPPVIALLEIIRLDRVFRSYPSVALAIQSFPTDQP